MRSGAGARDKLRDDGGGRSRTTPRHQETSSAYPAPAVELSADARRPTSPAEGCASTEEPSATPCGGACRTMDVPGSGLHTGRMNDNPQSADWLTWWSWPWRMMDEWGNPAVSFAPQALSQPILPGWLLGNTFNVTEENSGSPETEQEIVASHSYGQQLGRILDVVNEPIAERPAGAPDVQSIRDFRHLGGWPVRARDRGFRVRWPVRACDRGFRVRWPARGTNSGGCQQRLFARSDACVFSYLLPGLPDYALRMIFNHIPRLLRWSSPSDLASAC